MMFAIRDDDTSFWTQPEALMDVYERIWNHNIPVSLAVIPFAVQSFFLGDPERFYQHKIEKPIEENANLISFLQEKVQKGLVDIMLHGYSHQYYVQVQGGERVSANKEHTDQLRRQSSGHSLQWIGEYRWKDQDRLTRETIEGKTYLEKIFQKPVRIFVPPSNQLGSQGTQAVIKAGLNISGTLGVFPDRPLSLSYIRAYVRRWSYWARYRKIYPFPLVFDRHTELTAYTLTPRVSFEDLKRHFNFCQENRAPFVIATHHWELSRHSELLSSLYKIIDYALRGGGRPVALSDIFGNHHS